MTETIRNPIEWGADQARLTARLARAAVGDMRGSNVTALAVRRIGVADLREVLAQGWRDFGENRTPNTLRCNRLRLGGSTSGVLLRDLRQILVLDRRASRSKLVTSATEERAGDGQAVDWRPGHLIKSFDRGNERIIRGEEWINGCRR